MTVCVKAKPRNGAQRHTTAHNGAVVPLCTVVWFLQTANTVCCWLYYGYKFQKVPGSLYQWKGIFISFGFFPFLSHLPLWLHDCWVLSWEVHIHSLHTVNNLINVGHSRPDSARVSGQSGMTGKPSTVWHAASASHSRPPPMPHDNLPCWASVGNLKIIRQVSSVLFWNAFY